MGRGRIIGSLQNDREYLYEPLDYVAKGIVQVMAETFPWDDMNTSYDKVAKGELRFEALLKIQ
jgi:alcohol dehydrogenase